MTQAAVLHAPGQPLTTTEVGLEAPRRDEVAVQIGATGVCHSGIAVYQGTLPNPTPVVLGHEGAGTVAEVGEGATGISPGDREVLSWLAQCGAAQCPPALP
jgi:Zn-dependent alcohol dehydrogenase